MKCGSWADKVGAILRRHRIRYHIRTRKNQFEITISSGIEVQRLIDILLPHLVVKRPLAKRLKAFPKAPPRNRFKRIDDSYLEEICDLVDFVRRFNKGKNRRHKWDGYTIRRFFNK